MNEQEDPLVGAAMRCMDEGMAHQFLEHHKNSELSVDATIALMGLSSSSSSLQQQRERKRGEVKSVIFRSERNCSTNIQRNKSNFELNFEEISEHIGPEFFKILKKSDDFNTKLKTNPWGGSLCSRPMKKQNKLKSSTLRANLHDVMTHRFQEESIGIKVLSGRLSLWGENTDPAGPQPGEGPRVISSGGGNLNLNTHSGRRIHTANALQRVHQHNDALPSLIALSASLSTSQQSIVNTLNHVLKISDTEIEEIKESVVKTQQGSKALLKLQSMKLFVEDDSTCVTTSENVLASSVPSSSSVPSPSSTTPSFSSLPSSSPLPSPSPSSLLSPSVSSSFSSTFPIMPIIKADPCSPIEECNSQQIPYKQKSHNNNNNNNASQITKGYSNTSDNNNLEREGIGGSIALSLSDTVLLTHSPSPLVPVYFEMLAVSPQPLQQKKIIPSMPQKGVRFAGRNSGSLAAPAHSGLG